MSSNESPLVSAAKAIGKAAGKVASLAGVEAPPKPSGRLVKKNKAHLPRKMKKAQKKAQAAL
jgi:hypothetical protein